MKEDEFGVEFGGLSQGQGKGLLVGGKLRSEEDGGGFAPPRLESGSHRSLLGWTFLTRTNRTTSNVRSGS
jgi:hypothetical protein